MGLLLLLYYGDSCLLGHGFFITCLLLLTVLHELYIQYDYMIIVAYGILH